MRIFVTVGNALVPFDRLLQWVDEALAALGEDTFIEGVCQHGPSLVRPRGLSAREHLSRAEFEREMDLADVVVCHAGVGTLQDAIRAGHRPIVVPRRAAFSEIVNDHQLEVVSALGTEGKIIVAGDAKSLSEALARHARGEEKRGPRRELDPERLAPVAAAMGKGPAHARPSALGALVVRALATLGPPLERMRLR